MNRSPAQPANQLTNWLASIGLFLLALAPRLASLRAFVTADEAKWIKRSADFLLAFLQGDFAGTFVNPTPGVTTTWTGALGLALYARGQGVSSPGGLLDFLRAVPPFQVNLDVLQAVRWPTGVVTALGVLVAYRLARPLLGGRAAFAGAVLLALDPLYLAHSRFIHHDALATAFHTVAALSLLLCLRREGGGAGRYLVLSGVSMGLAFLTKPTTLFLLPAALVAAALFAWRGQTSGQRLWRRLAAAGGVLLLWGLVAYLTAFILWPAMWVRPVGQPRDVIANAFQSAASDDEEEAAPGELPELGLLYYPVQWAFKATPPVMLGLAAAIWALRKKKTGWGIAGGLLLYACALAALMAQSDKRAVRYLLPAIALLDLAAGWGLAYLWDAWTARRAHLAAGGRGLALGAALLAIGQGAFSLPYHPYYLTYYNPLVGGPWLAPRLIYVGWGEGLDEAGRYLSGKADASRLRAAAGYTSAFAPFFAGRPVGLDEGRVDYVVLYARQKQGGSPYPELSRYFAQRTPEKVISLAGVEYAWIYAGPSLSQVKTRLHAAGLTLVAFGLERQWLGTGEAAQVTLIWRGGGETGAVNLQLADEKGRLWGDEAPQQFRLTGNPPQSRYVLKVPPDVPRGQARLLAKLYDGSGSTPAQVEIGAVEVRDFRRPPVAHPLEADFSGQAALLGYDLQATALRPGGSLTVTLYWQGLGPTAIPYTAFVHLLDAQGRIWGQRDSQPGGGGWPTTGWARGEILADAYELDIAPDAPPGSYALELGLYDPQSGSRLSVLDGAGTIISDHILLPEKVTVE